MASDLHPNSTVPEQTPSAENKTHTSTKSLVPLEPGERIILEARKHMFVFYARILFIVGFFFIPLVFSPLIIKGINALTESESGMIVFGFFFTLWLLLLLILYTYHWTDHHLDVWVITTKHLFDIEQKGFFRREVTSCQISKIQDVSVEIDGLVATFFKFGMVHIHTAGESPDFSIKNAANPFAVKDAIMTAGIGQTNSQAL